eukprot:g66894.t1
MNRPGCSPTLHNLPPRLDRQNTAGPHRHNSDFISDSASLSMEADHFDSSDSEEWMTSIAVTVRRNSQPPAAGPALHNRTVCQLRSTISTPLTVRRNTQSIADSDSLSFEKDEF